MIPIRKFTVFLFCFSLTRGEWTRSVSDMALVILYISI